MWAKVKRYFRFLLTPVPNPEKWLFIGGCPNSGTTLLHEILAQHEDIGSMPKEGQFCTDQLISPYKIGVSRIWIQKIEHFYLDESSLPNINVRRLKKQWAVHYNDRSKPILMEKSPTNAVRLKWMQKEFQPAYFIGIYRNGYAVSKGIADKANCSIEIAAEQWLRSNEIMLRDFEALEHKLLISYEEFTNEPIAVMNRITTFLGINAFQDQNLSRSYLIQGKRRRIENLNAQNIQQLLPHEIASINRIAGRLFTKLKYDILD